MKIAFLTTEYPHPLVREAAGIGTSIHQLAKALVKQGHEPHIVIANQDQQMVFEEQGITYHLIERPQFAFLSFYRYRKLLERYINKQAQERGWQLIEAPDWAGLTAFMRLRIPLILRLHGADTYFCHLEGRKQKKKNYWLERNAIRRATAIISPSAFTANLTADLFGLSREKIVVIPHGLHVASFFNAAPNSFQRGLLLCAGTIIRKKGAVELPAIFKMIAAEYPDARLLLLGADAPDSATKAPSTLELVRQALGTEYQEKLEAPGKIPYADMQAYISSAHVCLFPTMAETFGMVTLEALAMEKAVVNSNFGWAREMIKDQQSGLLADPKDHRQFADQVLAILKDDDLRAALARGARQTVEQSYDIDKIVARNVAIYQTLIRP